MLSPARLTHLMMEFVFLLLGALVVWLALVGRIYFDRRGIPWLIISVALIAWGLIALMKPGDWLGPLQKWNRGASLILLGILMLAMIKVPFEWVSKLLAVTGIVLVLRGILGIFFISRPR
jgi:hypothetical protein